MTTFLRGGAALMIRVSLFALAVLVLLILVGAQAALGADTVSAQPLPQPESGGLTMAWLRDFAAFIGIIILVATFLWRVVVIDRLQEMGSAILADELRKRGLLAPRPDPASTFDFGSDLDPDPAWAAEADKVAPPPPPRPKPMVVPAPSAKEMAQKFTPRTRAKGHA